MSEHAKHTPGPWVRVGFGVYKLDIKPGEYHKGKPVEANRLACNVQQYHVLASLEETEANARLIAAAPDLLEACEFALGIIEHVGYRGGHTWELLTAAIAKATQSTADDAASAAPVSS